MNVIHWQNKNIAALVDYWLWFTEWWMDESFSRYYLRDVRRMEKLVTGDLTSVLSTDVNFLQLPFSEVASQLTRRDMQLFCSIDPVEYVNDLFEISSVPQLTRFSEVHWCELIDIHRLCVDYLILILHLLGLR